MKNAYTIVCEFLDRIMTMDSCLSFMIYKTDPKSSFSFPFERYHLKLIYHDNVHDDRSNSKRNYIKDNLLSLEDHFRENKEEYLDLSLTNFEKDVEWIEKQIPEFSWKDFQKKRKLNSFKKRVMNVS